MRCLVTLYFIFLSVSTGWAQKQERSLVDRLLRPDTGLQNSDQSKKFAVNNSAATERRGTVGTLYLSKPSAKSFADSRVFTTSEHRPRTFYDGAHTDFPNKNRNANSSSALETSSVGDIHNTNDALRSVAGRDFPGQRQFREEGKSQKSLDRQNPPLTVDQVRELLNKNK